MKCRWSVREIDFPSALAISTAVGAPVGDRGLARRPDLFDSEQVHISAEGFDPRWHLRCRRRSELSCLMSTVDNNLMPPEVGIGFSPDPETFVSVSPAMKALERAVRNLASSEVPVLLLGEPGTGKRALAFRIHQQSLRSDGGFHEAECSDLRPEHLRLGNGNNGVNSVVSEFGSGTVVFHEVSFLSSECQLALQEVAGSKTSNRRAQSRGGTTDFHDSRESGARGSPGPIPRRSLLPDE